MMGRERARERTGKFRLRETRFEFDQCKLKMPDEDARTINGAVNADPIAF